MLEKHGELFKQLSPVDKDTCKRKAIVLKRKKRDALAEQREMAMAQLSLLQQRRFRQLSDPSVTHLDSCRFDDADFSRFRELWAEYRMADCMRGFKEPPQRPAAAVEALLQGAQAKVMQAAKNAEPRWLKIDRQQRPLCR